MDRLPLAKIENVMTIGAYDGHAFLIRDIEKIVKVYVCNNCCARFTQACSLQRHADRDRRRESIVRVKKSKPRRQLSRGLSFQNITLPRNCYGGSNNKRRKFDIHHAMCGHGGERWIEKAPVDGYCNWHGCRKCFPNDRDKII